MNARSWWSRLLSAFVTLTMVTSLIPQPALAHALGTQDDAATTEDAVDATSTVETADDESTVTEPQSNPDEEEVSDQTEDADPQPEEQTVAPEEEQPPAVEEEVTSESTESEFKAQSDPIDGVIVKVEAEAGAFPADAKLEVKKVELTDAQAKAVDEVREEDQNVAKRYTFDVKVVDAAGNELQPANNKKVNVSFVAAEVGNNNLKATVYHVDDQTEEEIKQNVAPEVEKLDEVTDEAAAATDKNEYKVETDGFSYYTVEFTYGDLQYVLDGDSSIPLQTILDTVGLTGNIDSATSDAPELFAVEIIDGVWTVKAVKAFDTTQTLTVTLDGVEYVIEVTDSVIEVTDSVIEVTDNQGVQTESTVTATVYDVDGTTLLHTYNTLGEAITNATVNQTIVLSEGEFDIEGTPAEGVTITGQGQDKTTVYTSAKGNVIANKNVTIEKLSLDGKAASGVSYSGAINLQGDGATIRECNVSGGGNSTWGASISISLKANETAYIYNSMLSGGFRAVFLGSTHGNVVIDGCTIDPKGAYCINVDGGSQITLDVKNSIFRGWTSYSNSVTSAAFTNVVFEKGSNNPYDYCRPYSNTTFTGCTFDSEFNLNALSGLTHILKDCYKKDSNGATTLITQANYKTVSDGDGTVKANVATVDGVTYIDLDEAINACKAREAEFMDVVFYADPSAKLQGGYVAIEQEGGAYTVGKITAEVEAVNAIANTQTFSLNVIEQMEDGETKELKSVTVSGNSEVSHVELSTFDSDEFVDTIISVIDTTNNADDIKNIAIEVRDEEGKPLEAPQVTEEDGVKKATIDAKAWAVAYNETGDELGEVKVSNDVINNTKFTFRLPVPSGLANEGDVIEVVHTYVEEGNQQSESGKYVVKAEGESLYVEVTVTHFSTFEEIADANPTAVAYNSTTGTTYTDLADAFGNAVTGQTIVLLRDATLTNELVISDKKVTFDLYGNKLTANGGFGIASTNQSDAELTVVSTNGSATGTIECSDSYATYVYKATLKIADKNVKIAGVIENNSGTVELSAGTYTNNPNASYIVEDHEVVKTGDSEWVVTDTYDITYMNGDTAYTGLTPTTYNTLEGATLPADAPIENAQFKGWYKESTFATKITEITAGTIGDMTVYGKWVPYVAQVGSTKYDSFADAATAAIASNASVEMLNSPADGDTYELQITSGSSETLVVDWQNVEVVDGVVTAPEGYAVTQTASGTQITYTAQKQPASITHDGSKTYKDSLKAALEGAAEGDVVTVEKDQDMGSDDVNIPQSITLAGGKLDFGSGNGRWTVADGKTLTVDSAFTSEGAIFNVVSGAADTSTLVYNGGTYKWSTADEIWKLENAAAQVKDAGGQLLFQYASVAAAVDAATAGQTVELLKDNTETKTVTVNKALTIDLGTHTLTSASNPAIKVSSNVTIKNGKVESTNISQFSHAILIESGKATLQKLEVSSGSLAVIRINSSGALVIGDDDTHIFGDISNNSGITNITAGYFGKDPSSLLSGGYTVENTTAVSGAPYHVAAATAKIGNKGYASFEAALADAVDGNTITLLKDDSVANAITISGKSLNVDLGGKKLTFTQGDNKFNAQSNVTFTNGTIDITNVHTSGDAIFRIGNDNTANVVSLEGVTLTGDGYSSAYGVFYLYDSPSTLNIKDSTLNLANDASATGGVIKANATHTPVINVDHSTFNIGNTGSTAYLRGTWNITNGSTIDMTIDGNAFNRSRVTIDNSNVTIESSEGATEGRGFTAEGDGDIVIKGTSVVDVSGMPEGDLRFNNGGSISVEDTAKLKADTIATASNTPIDLTVAATATAPHVAVSSTGTEYGYVTYSDLKTAFESTAVATESTVVLLADDNTNATLTGKNLTLNVVDNDVLGQVTVGADATLTITGTGVFSSYPAKTGTGKLAIAGGYFPTEVAETDCADGFIPVHTETAGKGYTVKQGSVIVRVIYGSSNYGYSSMKDAFDSIASATSDNVTIKILNDVSTSDFSADTPYYLTKNVTIESGKLTNEGVTADFTNCKLYTTGGYTLTIANNVTAKNYGSFGTCHANGPNAWSGGNGANGFGGTLNVNGHVVDATELNLQGGTTNINAKNGAKVSYDNDTNATAVHLSWGANLNIEGSNFNALTFNSLDPNLTPDVKAGDVRFWNYGSMSVKDAYVQLNRIYGTDADSTGVSTLTLNNAVLQLTDGNNEFKSKPGTVNLTQSSIYSAGAFSLGNQTTLNMDYASSITTSSWVNNGTVNVDVADLNLSAAMPARTIVTVTGGGTVTPGTINLQNNDSKNYTVTVNGSSIQIARSIASVTRNNAVVGYYATLADAFGATQAGDIVTLLDNVEVSDPITINKTVTFDLNGKTVTNNSTGKRPFQVVSMATPEVDEEGDETGSYEVAETTLTVVGNNGSMVIPDGGTAYGFFDLVGYGTGLVINGGTIQGDGGNGSLIRYAVADSVGFANDQRIELNNVTGITRSRFVAYSTTAYLSSINVNGGEYTHNNDDNYNAGYLKNAFQFYATNGIFDGVSITSDEGTCVLCSGSYSNNVVFKNNTFEVKGTSSINDPWNNAAISVQSNGKITIESGTYTSAGLYGIATANSGATINIEGGTISGKTGARIYGGGYAGNTVLNMTGGTLTGTDGVGLKVLEITDGAGTVVANLSDGKVEGGINIENSAAVTSAVVNISGSAHVTGDLVNTSNKLGTYNLTGAYYLEDPTAEVDPTQYAVITVTDANDVTWYTLSAAPVAINTTTNKSYSTLAEAISAAAAGNTVKLLTNATVTETININKNLTIDFNDGKTISSTTTGNLFKVDNAKLTFDGTGTIDTSNASTDNGYYTIQVLGATSDPGAYPYGVVVPAGVAINSNGWAVQVASNGGHAYGVQVDLAGTITAPYGVTVNGGVADTEGKVPVVNLGGTINNGMLYAAGYAKYNVNATIAANDANGGADCAIEVRAGELNVTGGTYSTTATPTETNANGSGTTSKGAAIAVAQHNTKLPIEVNISGGTFSGYSAFYESNPQGNGASDLQQIKVNITDGTFNATGTQALYCADIEQIGGFVKGGNFSSQVPYEYCVEGKMPSPKDTTTNMYTVVEGSAVACIGEVYYGTLTEALDAAQEGDTIKLLKDVEGKAFQFKANNTTLDLNGYTVSLPQDDTSINTDTAVFTIKTAITVKIVNNSDTVGTISGKVSNNYGVGVLLQNAGAQLNFQGGKITNARYGIAANSNDGGTAKISGGEIDCQDAVRNNDGNDFTISGGTIKGVIYGKVFITGGKIDSTFSYSGAEISGGVFKNTFEDRYLADGYVIVANTDEATKDDYPYTVSNTVVAKIGDSGYDTLAAAVAAAEDGKTVTLVKDLKEADGTALTERVNVNASDKSITVDLNGHTIACTHTSGNGSAFNVVSGTLTLKNGTIDGTGVTEVAGGTTTTQVGINDGICLVTVRSGARLNLEDDINMVVNSKNGCCVYPFTSGEVYISDGTYENKTTEPYQYKEGYMGLTINQANNNPQSIHITGGTFKGNDPQLGDDSNAERAIDSGYVAMPANGTTATEPGTYSVVEGGRVTFDTDGGTPATIAEQRVAKDQKATQPSDPTKENYVFEYWGTVENETWTEFKFDETTIQQDVSLKAKWATATAKITKGEPAETTYYKTLQEAVNAADGDTVTLVNDSTAGVTIDTGKTVTIDLNGKNINVTEGDALLNKGTLTVTGSGTVTTSADDSAAVANVPGATATLNGGSYTSDNWYVVKNLGTMSIGENVTIYKPEDSTNTASLIDNGWYGNQSNDTLGGTYYAHQDGTASLTITGGTFKGEGGAKSCSVVKNDDYSELNISGGTFDSTKNGGNTDAATLLNYGNATISGGTFKGSYPISNGGYGDEADPCVINISGGEFISTGDSMNGSGGGTTVGGSAVNITGGTFTGAKFIDGSYYTTDISGGIFGVDFDQTEKTIFPTGKALEPSTTHEGMYELKPSLKAFTVETEDNVYTGKFNPAEITSITAKTEGATVADDDYVVEYKDGDEWKQADESVPFPVEAKEYTIRLKGVEDKPYAGTVSEELTYKITAATITQITVAEGLVYNGASQPTDDQITVIAGNILVPEDQYTITYVALDEQGQPVGDATDTAPVNQGKYRATVSAKEGSTYKDSDPKASVDFTIAPKKITDSTVSAYIAAQSFKGQEINPVAEVVDDEAGAALVAGTEQQPGDYTIDFTNNTEIGTATATITGTGNYTGTRTVKFEIVANTQTISDATAKLMQGDAEVKDDTYTYDGNEKEPTVVLTPALDASYYEVSYYNNKDAGEAIVFVKGTNGYVGSKELTFKINKAQVARPTVQATVVDYTGSEIEAQINTGQDADKYTLSGDLKATEIGTYTVTATLKDANNYEWAPKQGETTTDSDPIDLTWNIVAGQGKKVTAPSPQGGLIYSGEVLTGVEAGTGFTLTGNTATNAGDYTATATLESGYVWDEGEGNTSTDPKTIPWTIDAKPLDNDTATVTTASDAYVYTGTEIKPTVTVKDGTKTLVEGTDYDVTYQNNTDVSTTENKAKAVVTFKGNYSGTAQKEFTISRAVATTGGINCATLQQAIDAALLGATVTLLQDVQETDSIFISKNVRLDLGGNTLEGPSDKWAVRVNGTADVTLTNGTISSTQYGGVRAADNSTVTITDGTVIDALYWGVTPRGNATVNVTGGEIHGVLAISSNGSAGENATINISGGKIIADKTDEDGYSAGIYLPSGTLTVTGGEITGKEAAIMQRGGTAIVRGGTLSYTNENAEYKGTIGDRHMQMPVGVLVTDVKDSGYPSATSAGTTVYAPASLTAPAGGNITKGFTDDDLEATTLNANVVTSAEPAEDSIAEGYYAKKLDDNTYIITPKTAIAAPTGKSLTYNGEEQTGVEAGEGYELTGNTGTNAGTDYKATATLKDGYAWSDGATGTKEIPWTIAKANIANATVDAIPGQTYDGTDKTPEPVVKMFNATLEKGEEKDYTVSYTANKEVGTATVTITGKGNYEGTLTTYFAINKASAETVTVALSSEEAIIYNGSAQEPAVTVKYGNTTLTPGGDYDLVYYNNVNAGTGTVVATLKGNYEGSGTTTFNIAKAEVAQPTIEASVNYTGAEIAAPINKGANADKYRLTGDLKATEVGTYNVTAALKDANNYKWAGDTATSDDLTFIWNIVKTDAREALEAKIAEAEAVTRVATSDVPDGMDLESGSNYVTSAEQQAFTGAIEAAKQTLEAGDESAYAAATTALNDAIAAYETAAQKVSKSAIAKIGDTKFYASLRDAIAGAEPNETIELLADDQVSFTADNLEISIGKAVTIDGQGHAVYGINDYNYWATGSDHDIFINGAAGDVTIKNLRITEFGGSSYVAGMGIVPVYTSGSYNGKLTLDNVTIDDFNNRAMVLGGGTAEITNCTITGDAPEGRNPQGEYFQQGIDVYGAEVTVSNTTVTGMGAKDDTYGTSDVAGAVQLTKTGSIDIQSGTFEGQYSLIIAEVATGIVHVEDGTFNGPMKLEAEDLIVVSGGNYEEYVESEDVVAGKLCTTVPGFDGYYHIVDAITVTFDANGGKFADSTTTKDVLVPKGEAIAKAEVPEAAYEGHTFTGWTINDTDYDLTTPVTENVELKASWTENVTVVEVPTAITTNVYDGQPKSGIEVPAEANFQVVEEQGFTNSETNAGAYKAKVALKEGNFAWSDGSTDPKTIEWSIAKAGVDKPQANFGTLGTGLVYNGQEQDGTTATEGYAMLGTLSATDAGDYSAIFVVDANHYWNDDLLNNACEVKWSIQKKDASITPNDARKVAGMDDPELTANVEGVVEGETLDYTLSRAEGEYAGEYPITVTLGNNPNYNVTTETGTFTIEEAPVVIATIEGTEYASLRAAIEAAQDGDTIELIANDSVSFAEGGIVIDKNITINGNWYTVYGDPEAGEGNVGSMAEVTDDNVHGFYVKSGNVTINNLYMSEFGNMGYVNKFGCVPILTSIDYNGTLTLNDVGISEFNRQAICINNGTFAINGGYINANATNKGDTSDHFQQGIEIRGGSGTITSTNVYGGGSNVGYPGIGIVSWSTGEVTLNNVYVSYEGIGVEADYNNLTVAGDQTWVSGSEKALFVEDGGKLTVTGGTFQGELAVDGIDNSSIEVSGGNYSEYVVPEDVVDGKICTTVTGSDGYYHIVNKMTVKFDANGGSFGEDDQHHVIVTKDVFVPEGEAVAPADVPEASWEDHTFAGWKLNDADYDLTTPVTENVELKAAWTVDPIAVEVPTAVLSNVYDGQPKSGIEVPAEANFQVVDVQGFTNTAINAGAYKVQVALKEGNFVWSDGTTDPKTIEWSIAKAGVDKPEPNKGELQTGLVYNGEVQNGTTATEGSGYAMLGTLSAIDAGDYSAIFVVDANHYWNDDLLNNACEVKWSIQNKDASGFQVTGVEETYTYTGSAIEPEVTITDGDMILAKGTDYDVVYGPNTEVGPGTVTVNYKGNYSGIKEIGFTIEEPVMEQAIVPMPVEGLEYDGTEKTGVPAGEGYTITNNTGIDAGSYEATATLDDGYVWSDSTTEPKTIPWTIAPKGLAKEDVTVESGTYVYDGTKIEPAVTVTDGDELLVEDTDYDVLYTDNINAGTATVTVTGKGNYAGTVENTFEINKAEAIVAADDETITYGAETPVFGATVTGLVGTDELNYEVTYDGEVPTNVGTYQNMIKATGAAVQGNYNVTYEDGTYTIEPKDIAPFAVDSIPAQTYTGSGLEPEVAIWDGETKLGEDDINVTYDDHTNVGVAKVTIEGKGNYTGATTTYFSINKADAKTAIVALATEELFVYDGQEKTPAVVVTYNDTQLEESDYDITYSNNVNAGTATVIATMKGNYEGTATGTFIINKAEVTKPTTEDQQYDGTEKTGVDAGQDAKLFRIFGTTKATEVGDYTATAALKDVNNYKWVDAEEGEESEDLELNWSIFINKTQVAVPEADEAIYNATPQTGIPESEDYTISGAETNVGTYQATLSLTDPVFTEWEDGTTEDKIVEYTIQPRDVADANIANIRGRGYDGTPYEPKPAVTVDGRTLAEGTDFDYSYTNNIYASNGNPAILTVTGKGNYTGTATKEYEVWKNGQPMDAWAVKRQAPVASLATRAVTVEAPVHVAHAVSAGSPLEYRKMGGDRRLNVDLYTGRVTVSKGTPVGTYDVTIRVIAFGGSNYADGSKTVDCQVQVVSGKLDQSMEVTAKDVTRTADSLKSADYVTRPFEVAMAAGNVTYKKDSGSDTLTVDSSGRLTIAKGTGVGTYTAQVTATAAGDAGYNPCTRTVTVKVTVK